MVLAGSDYLTYFSVKYLRVTLEYLLATFLSFVYLFIIITLVLLNSSMGLFFQLILLGLNLFAIVLFNIGMRKVYIESITYLEKKMSESMKVYYPGMSKDLKEFSSVLKLLAEMLKRKEKS